MEQATGRASVNDGNKGALSRSPPACKMIELASNSVPRSCPESPNLLQKKNSGPHGRRVMSLSGLRSQAISAQASNAGGSHSESKLELIIVKNKNCWSAAPIEPNYPLARKHSFRRGRTARTRYRPAPRRRFAAMKPGNAKPHRARLLIAILQCAIYRDVFRQGNQNKHRHR